MRPLFSLSYYSCQSVFLCLNPIFLMESGQSTRPLISSLLINKIEDFSSLWFPSLSCYWKWGAGKIAGSTNNIVTKPRGVSQWCSRTPDKDLSASRLQLQTRAGYTPSPSNISSAPEKRFILLHAKDSFTLLWLKSTAKAVITAYRSESSVYLGYSFSSSLYEFKVCVKPHKKDGIHSYL